MGSEAIKCQNLRLTIGSNTFEPLNHASGLIDFEIKQLGNLSYAKPEQVNQVWQHYHEHATHDVEQDTNPYQRSNLRRGHQAASGPSTVTESLAKGNRG